MIISLASAQEQTLKGNFELNSCVQLKQTCANCTYVSVTRVAYPNSSIDFSNYINMTKTASTYYHDYCNTSLVGTYIVDWEADPNGITTVGNYDFFVGEPSGDNIKIFIYLIFIILTFGLIFLFIMNLAKLATVSTTIFDVALSFSIYFILLMTYWLSQNYLVNSFINDHITLYISMTTFSAVLLPLISLFITIFVKATQKKSNLSVQELTGWRRMSYG